VREVEESAAVLGVAAQRVQEELLVKLDESNKSLRSLNEHAAENLAHASARHLRLRGRGDEFEAACLDVEPPPKREGKKAGGGSTNKEKARKKNFLMLRKSSAVQGKLKRSLREQSAEF
jgi:hypothetical protein